MEPLEIEGFILERINSELPRVRVDLMPDYGAEEVLSQAAIHEDGAAFIQYTGTQNEFLQGIDKISFAVFVSGKGYRTAKKRLDEIKNALRNFHYEPPYKIFIESDGFDVERNGVFIYTVNVYTLRHVHT